MIWAFAPVSHVRAGADIRPMGPAVATAPGGCAAATSARADSDHECESSSQAAMLTGMVNIAVFAAFRIRSGRRSIAITEFKPICAIWQLDISRYGWQKRQGCGNGWHGGRQERQGC